MRCPFCLSEDTKVNDKRDSEGITKRRRECLKCSKRFTTYERVEEVDLMILKKDGRREQFSRDKLKAGIVRACEKRPVSSEDIENLLNEIESKIRTEEKDVHTKVIGELVMRGLKKLDKIAYIRFASVYRDFADIEDFKEEIKKLK